MPQIPSDIWAEIICSLDRPVDIAAMALVCRSASEEAETVLYRSVSLSSDAQIVLFYYTVSSNPRKASLIRQFLLLVDAIVDDQSPTLLVGILRTLLHLECLSIHRKVSFNRILVDSYEYMNVFALRFSELRLFSTNTSTDSLPHMVSFVCAHPRLEEVHLDIPYPTDSPISYMDFPSSIHTLTCSPQLLSHHLTSPPNTLAHLFLCWYTSEEFFRVAKILGPQLVSLRLSMQRDLSENDVWSLGDLAIAFPRLRLLQLDMGGSFRYNFPINLRMKKPTQLRLPQPPPANGLTLVWAPYTGQLHGFDMFDASLAQNYLTEFAFDVLAEWNPYVRRIIFRHALSPFVSAILSEDRTHLICALAADMTDDYWKYVKAS
ncbi:hypothetical protein C8Q73DRAFT_647711 [Cubamyces lactineus]|nr:hypothetical protein C8Q73DRAFT_647711 [Cubamyces lactineus]